MTTVKRKHYVYKNILTLVEMTSFPMYSIFEYFEWNVISFMFMMLKTYFQNKYFDENGLSVDLLFSSLSNLMAQNKSDDTEPHTPKSTLNDASWNAKLHHEFLTLLIMKCGCAKTLCKFKFMINFYEINIKDSLLYCHFYSQPLNWLYDYLFLSLPA